MGRSHGGARTQRFLLALVVGCAVGSQATNPSDSASIAFFIAGNWIAIAGKNALDVFPRDEFVKFF